MNFRKGDKVVCIASFSGVPDFGVLTSKHHNPPTVGEVFTVLDTSIERDGNLYLVLGEVTNTQKYRNAYDVWCSKKFKKVADEEVKNERVGQLDEVLTELCMNYT
jgi:hypothetical protein